MRYNIQQITVWSAIKFGAIIGAVLGIWPGLTIGLLARWIVGSLRTWLESWLSLEALGRSFNLLDAVRLGDFLADLQHWDARGWLLVMFLILLGMLGGALVTGLLSGLAALVYNLVAAVSGGLVVKAAVLEGVVAQGGTLVAPSAVPPPLAAIKPPAHAPEAAAAWLVAQATQRRWPVGQGETRIGSRRDNQIVLDGLAGNHAAIRWENGRFILYDYSGGQTWVNGRSLIGPNMIKAGFQIRLANQEFLFQE